MKRIFSCYFQSHTRIGRSDAEKQQDIQLRGPGIQPQHCEVEVVDAEVFITPLPDARTLVNGRIVQKRTKICHGHRILLGANHFFQLSCPKQNGKYRLVM